MCACEGGKGRRVEIQQELVLGEQETAADSKEKEKQVLSIDFH